jgi:hypothetical protein
MNLKFFLDNDLNDEDGVILVEALEVCKNFNSFRFKPELFKKI